MAERRSKYNVDRSEEGKQDRTYAGALYDSESEMRFAQELDYRVLARDIQGWMRQVRFSLVVNGVKIAEYVADFVVTLPDGNEVVYEVKGAQTETWRLKHRLFQALHPDVRLVVIPANEYRPRQRGAV